ncbi:MAG: LacI family DNA-binding transcriptional regulator [Candidatus Promineifilaceae bacterium]
MKKRVTIDDVARKVGVSRQTVSRAINGKHDISAATRARVLESVEQLGYRPSRIAQGMATNLTRTIGLIIGDVTNPAHSEIVRGFQDAAQAQNYNVFLRNTDRNPENEREAIESLMSENVDGLVLVASMLEHEVLEKIAERFRPIVLLHRKFDHPNVSSILINIERAADIALNYLIGSGHKHIGLITRHGDLSKSRHAIAYKNVLAKQNITLGKDWIVQADTSLDGGFAATRQLLTKNPEITAVFAYNDIMAVGAMSACRLLGKSIPDDCSILGFNDISLASYVTPTLSTIRYFTTFVGNCAFERILEMIEHVDGTFPPLILECELVIRESTGMHKPEKL